MIERVKVDTERLGQELKARGMNWATLAKAVGKSESYFSSTLNKYDGLPVPVVDFISLKLGIPTEDITLSEKTKVQTRDEYDDIYVAVNDALIDALTSDAFQEAMFKSIWGALKLYRKEMRDDSMRKDS